MGKSIVYMGTPEFAVAPLKALIEANITVAAVVTVADKPAGRGRKLNESAVKKAMEAVDEAEAKRVEAQEAQGAADDRSRSLEREIAGLRQLLEAARVRGDVRDAQVTR